jgi:hypothetical protein
MLRNVALVAATLVLGLTTLAGQAQAQQTQTQCAAMLDGVELAQTSADAYATSLAQMDAERTELVAGIAALDAQLVGTAGKRMFTLRAERDAMIQELTMIDELRPDVAAQLDALREQIEQSERGYIACIETTIGS